MIEFVNSTFLGVYLRDFYFWLKLNSVGRLFSATSILLFAMLFRNLFSFFVVKLLNFLVLKKIAYGQEKYIREIGKPIAFMPVVVGCYFAISVLRIPSSLVYYTRNLLKSLYVFSLSWFVFSFINPIGFMFKKSHLDNTKTVIITWGVRIAKFLVVIVGLSIFLENWGVRVSALIASLGIVGMAVALGAQDMFKNIISGVAIISEHRFSVGDIVKLEDIDKPIEGVIENIGFRSTMVRKFDRTLVFVPNSTFADAAVINFSSRMYRRIEWVLHLEYRTSAEQLRYIVKEIKDYLYKNPDFVKPPEAIAQVKLDDFGDSSINLLIYCFTNTNVWAEWLRIKEELLLRIKEIVEEAGAAFAFSTSSVYIEKMESKMHSPSLPSKLKSKLDSEGEVYDYEVNGVDL